jgi:hypothetical protein
MAHAVPASDERTVIELDSRATICVVEGCGGSIVRRSLGSGMAVHRCTRCFRRYRVRDVAPQSRLRRFVTDFVSWRD